MIGVEAGAHNLKMVLAPGVHMGQWVIEARLGSGACGQVYQVRSLTSLAQYAMKLAPVPKATKGKRTKSHAERLADAVHAEYMFYQHHLRDIPFIPSIPSNAYGESGGYRYLVMELLGETLAQRFSPEKGPASWDALAEAGIQMVSALQCIHERKLLMNDVKPDNFMYGLPDSPKENQVLVLCCVCVPVLCLTCGPKLHAIDFGVAERFVQATTGKHVLPGPSEGMAGTPLFWSVAVEQGHKPSRRDDLESVAYVLLYLANSSRNVDPPLPWMGQTNDHDRIQAKTTTALETVCLGAPPGWLSFLHTVRLMEFDAEPDYECLRGCLLDYPKEEATEATATSTTTAPTQKIAKRKRETRSSEQDHDARGTPRRRSARLVSV